VRKLPGRQGFSSIGGSDEEAGSSRKARLVFGAAGPQQIFQSGVKIVK
jgi:hypothetical protein